MDTIRYALISFLIKNKENNKLILIDWIQTFVHDVEFVRGIEHGFYENIQSIEKNVEPSPLKYQIE